MKKLSLVVASVLIAGISMSFVPGGTTPAELVGTKWISPVSDTAYQSLCFTSEKTVMYYPGEYEMSFEVGYTLSGDHIEIMGWGDSTRLPETRLVLTEDNGVLRQISGQSNSFPKVFVQVPGAVCD